MGFFDEPLEPDPVIEAYKKDIDRTLIRENLKLSHEQRILKLMEMQRNAEELRRAGRRAKVRSTASNARGAPEPIGSSEGSERVSERGRGGGD